MSKVRDNDVVGCLGAIPQSANEIGAKIGIHRSNVIPRLNRLEKAGLAGKIGGKWVASQPVQGTARITTLTDEQLRLAEALLIGDEPEIYEVSELNGDVFHQYKLLHNASIADDSDLLDFFAQICGIMNGYYDMDTIDTILADIREYVTDEPSPAPTTTPTTTLTPEQLRLAEQLILGENESDDDIVRNTDDDAEINKLRWNADLTSRNELLSVLNDIANMHVHPDHYSVDDVDEVFDSLKDKIFMKVMENI